MDYVILIFAIAAALISAACLMVLARRKNDTHNAQLLDTLTQLEARINARIAEFETRNTATQGTAAHTLRTELRDTLASLGGGLNEQLAHFSARFDGLSKNNEERADALRKTLTESIDVIRKNVDEKLSATLETRLGESFKIVSERLEAVQRGLGEMQSLATGVGDLKRVLGNVKERGTWGEYQLGAILDEILTPQQFDKNVAVAAGRERVEFAVRLPGRGGAEQDCVWLPIDSKFPKESYERLIDAARAADAAGVDAATAELKRDILKMAKDIQDKYIVPPMSTDFGILFLPTEGLYAEVLKQPGLHDLVQQKHRVIVAGPTTLSAILNSLRVGFHTLAIEQRSVEVQKILQGVKVEFQRFSDVLEKLKRQVGTVSNTLDESFVRTRAMARTLRGIEINSECGVRDAELLEDAATPSEIEDSDDEE